MLETRVHRFHHRPMSPNDASRRELLKRLALVAVGPSMLSLSKPAAAAARPSELAFAHLHTGEFLNVAFADNGQLLSDGLLQINRLLRDFRTGEVYPITPDILDILHTARMALNPNGVYEVISGFRSAKTNDMLHTTTSGVAKKSLHTEGRAVDVRLRGVSTKDLRDTLRRLQRGGVGYYAKSDFVHVDNGRVRFW